MSTRRCRAGSDRTLRRMHRKYRPRHYADRVLKARRADAGRGDRRRRDGRISRARPTPSSRRAADSSTSMPFTYLHVFTYSERPGTPAAELRQRPDARAQGAQSHAARVGGREEPRRSAEAWSDAPFGGDAARDRGRVVRQLPEDRRWPAPPSRIGSYRSRCRVLPTPAYTA